MQGQELLAFERYMTFKSKGGNHLQFNVLPVPMAVAKHAQRSYESVASRHQVRLKEVIGPDKVLCLSAAL